MGALREVLVFLGRAVRRLAVSLLGLVLLLMGVIMLVTPGPGLLGIIAGLAVLSTEYTWARRALERARQRSRQGVRKVQDVRRAASRGSRREGRDQGAPDS